MWPVKNLINLKKQGLEPLHVKCWQMGFVVKYSQNHSLSYRRLNEDGQIWALKQNLFYSSWTCCKGVDLNTIELNYTFFFLNIHICLIWGARTWETGKTLTFWTALFTAHWVPLFSQYFLLFLARFVFSYDTFLVSFPLSVLFIVCSSLIEFLIPRWSTVFQWLWQFSNAKRSVKLH